MTNKQQLKIDLSSLRYGPHPEVDKVYKENKADHLHWKLNPSYVNEERLRLCSQASGKPIKYKITSCYRRALPGGREYLLFHLAANSQDYFGNIIDHFFSTCGKYEKPIIQRSYGIPDGRRLASNTDITKTREREELEVFVNDFQTVYEWPFEQHVDQIREWYRKGILDENTRLYVWQGTNKYTVNDFERFCSLNLEDLVLISRVGNRFAGLLANQELTPRIMDSLREKLTQETITAINTADKTK